MKVCVFQILQVSNYLISLLVCFPNGTMVITAVVDTLPDLDPGKMVLNDGKCQPKEFNDHKALFKFNINSCGTTRTVEWMGGSLVRVSLRLPKFNNPIFNCGYVIFLDSWELLDL